MKYRILPILTHGDHIRATNWQRPHCAKFGTIEGYCREHRKDDDHQSYAKAKRLNHETAWSVWTGSTLCDSPSFYEQKDKDYANAIPVNDGDLVMAEGRTYRVKIVKGNERSPRNSDPIHFEEVTDD